MPRRLSAFLPQTARVMRSLSISLMLAWTHVGVWCTIASADGGKVVFMEQQDGARLTVFISPTPLRAGPIDVSTLLQDAETGEPIPDSQVTVKLDRAEGQRPILARATKDAATNKLLQAALVELPEPGAWDVEIDCSGKRGSIHARFTVIAAPRSPSWLNVWPWFSWPAGAVLVFSVHRRLVRRRQAKSHPMPSPSLSRRLS